MAEIINSEKAPAAIGPYSQAVKAGNFLFISGQLPINPVSGDFAGNDIRTQTKQALTNLEAILNEANMDLSNVVKVSVFLADMNDFVAMNEVYATFFKNNPPARIAVQVARLPKDALVEIEAIAYRE